MFPLVRQLEQRDCGAAALAMISKYYGKSIPVPIIAEYIKVDQHGSSIYSLLDGAAKLQLYGSALEGNAHEFFDSFKKQEFALPLIARILNSENYEHYVVIYKISPKWVYIADPGEGKYKLSYEQFTDCFLGQIICFQPQERYKKERFPKINGLGTYILPLMKQPKRLITIWLLALITTGIGLVSAYLYQYMVDRLIARGTVSDGLKHFAVLLLITLSLYLIRFGVHIVRGKLLAKFNIQIQELLHLSYFDSLLHLKKEFFDNHSAGDLISRSSDADQVHEAVSQILLSLTLDAIVVLGSGYFLLKTDRTLASIIFCLTVLYLVITIAAKKPLEKHKKDLMIQSANLTAYNTESIHNMELTKSVNAQNNVMDKMKEIFKNIQTQNYHLSMLSLSKDGIIELLYGIGSLLTLWVAVQNIHAGTLTLGAFMSFTTLSSYFMEPIQKVFSLQELIQSGNLAAQRLQDITLRSREHPEGSDFKNGVIHVENIQFRYGNRDLVLHDFHLNAAEGEKIAIVGPSGCGKSTFLKLLMGFYTPEAGYISIGEQNLQQISKVSLREHIGYISQETALFADTVRNNLLFGNTRPVDDEEIIHVLHVCGCSFIFDLPFGLDTMLDERGNNFSGGEKQRLGIVRTLLRHPSILLLDEATSALDNKGEKQIMDYISTLECTVIMCAHRLSTIRSCDQILYMEKGTVLERGKHHALLQKEDRYAALWAAQDDSAA